MDFLLDPNIAYLVLLAGIMLIMLAVASPGTGILEVAAFFMLVVAGYTVYNLAFNWWALVVLAASIAPFVYAIQKPKRELYLGLSLLLLLVGSLFLFAGEDGLLSVNPLVAIVASSLVTGFLWIAVRKSMQAAHERPSHDLEALIGLMGESRTAIHAEGSVQVNGELWSARSDQPIPAGKAIRVLRREGFVLVVEKEAST